jgi:hypothetical protein
MPDLGRGMFAYVARAKTRQLTTQAGSIIIQEAGGFFSGGKEAFVDNVPVGDIIIGRRYVAVRPVAPTEVSRCALCNHSADQYTQNETAEQIQRRIIKELYEVVEPWTNSDMP